MKLIEMIFVILVFLITENNTTMFSRFKEMTSGAASKLENYNMFQKTKSVLKPNLESYKNKVLEQLQKYVKILQSRRKLSMNEVMRGSKRMLLVKIQLTI